MIGLGKTESKQQFAGEFALLSAAYAQAGEKPLEMYAKTDGFIQPSQEGDIINVREEKGEFQVYTLSNGIEVWFQKDEKAANRAYVYLVSQGGKAALDKSLYPAFEVATMSAARSGLGDFSGADEVTKDQVFAVHDALFKENRGFKMVILADVEPEQITPLLRKYVASIDLRSGRRWIIMSRFNLMLKAA